MATDIDELNATLGAYARRTPGAFRALAIKRCDANAYADKALARFTVTVTRG